LESLPVPSSEDTSETETSEALTWFEKIVQKTLTAPIKPKGSTNEEEEAEDESFSPLMKNALVSLSASTSPPTRALQGFVQTVFVSFLSTSRSIEQTEKLYESIKRVWKGFKEDTKSTLKMMSDVVEIVKGGKEKKLEGGNVRERITEMFEDDDCEEERIVKLVRELNPRKENMFVAFGDDREGLEA
jgi:hypothetical protein